MDDRILSDIRASLALVARHLRKIGGKITLGTDPELAWTPYCSDTDYEISPDFADHFSRFGTDGSDACFEIRPAPSKTPRGLLESTREAILSASDRYSLSVGGYSWPLGGHLHVGFSDGRIRDFIKYYRMRFARLLDRFLYPLMILSGPARVSTTYFTIGTYREQPHGVEWRPPGSQWLIDPDATYAVYRLLKKVSAIASLYLMMSNSGSFFGEIDESMMFFINSIGSLFNDWIGNDGRFPCDPRSKWEALTEFVEGDVVYRLWRDLAPGRPTNRLIGLIKLRIEAGMGDPDRIFAGSINEQWGGAAPCRHGYNAATGVDISEVSRELFPRLSNAVLPFGNRISIRIRCLREDRDIAVHIGGFDARRASAIASELGSDVVFVHMFSSGRDLSPYKPELQIYPHPTLTDKDAVLAQIVIRILIEKLAVSCKGKVPPAKINL